MTIDVSDPSAATLYPQVREDMRTFLGVKDTSQGPAGTITIGTVESVAASENATVANAGSPTDAILNFGIPRGADGAAGTVAIGDVTALEPGETPTVINAGTDTAAVLNFGIPRGADGAAGTISIGDVTALEPGETPTVINSGTDIAAVFEFGIPRGAPGARGASGTITIGTVATLEPGEPATVINSGTAEAAILDFGIPATAPAEGTMLAATYDPDGDGVIAIEQGGTGATSAEAAREALGIARAEDLTSAVEKIQDDFDELAWTLTQKAEDTPRGVQLRGTSTATSSPGTGGALVISPASYIGTGYNSHHNTEGICTIDSTEINISSDIGRVRVTVAFELSRSESGSANISVYMWSDVYTHGGYVVKGSIAFASSTNGFTTIVSPDIVGGSKFKLYWANNASSSITATVEALIYIEVLD